MIACSCNANSRKSPIFKPTRFIIAAGTVTWDFLLIFAKYMSLKVRPIIIFRLPAPHFIGRMANLPKAAFNADGKVRTFSLPVLDRPLREQNLKSPYVVGLSQFFGSKVGKLDWWTFVQDVRTFAHTEEYQVLYSKVKNLIEEIEKDDEQKKLAA